MLCVLKSKGKVVLNRPFPGLSGCRCIHILGSSDLGETHIDHGSVDAWRGQQSGDFVFEDSVFGVVLGFVVFDGELLLAIRSTE
jgi:hypothetical protein